MTFSHLASADEFGRKPTLAGVHPDNVQAHASSSAVSWAAILAGATVAAALSLILLVLGTSLGLTAVSPWVHEGISATTFGWSAILWVSFTQLLAFGMGGYLAGRLRTRWAGVDTDEVYFRDTAHGFLTWAVATLLSAALLTSVIGSIIGGGIKAGASVAGDVASSATAVVANSNKGELTPAANAGELLAYSVDSLFRADVNAAGNSAKQTEATSTAKVNNEVALIFINSMHSKALPADDLRYVGRIVAQHTGLSQTHAEQRVSETFTRLQTRLHDAEITVKEAADKARKASAYAGLWLFISLLIGAFFASWAATFGGRSRDA
ncbi:MAG: hypothetical protein HOP04_14880 [Methylophilaceae bacterium]|nr:hypothetical protein [Methylophilaceae bacterium]